MPTLVKTIIKYNRQGNYKTYAFRFILIHVSYAHVIILTMLNFTF